MKKDSTVFLTDNITIGSNTIQSDSDADSADSAESAVKIDMVKCTWSLPVEYCGMTYQFEWGMILQKST